VTVLVTGANGFVGHHAVRALAARERRVRALVRDLDGAGALAGADCELVKGDVTDPESLRQAVAGCDAVVHLVAIIAGRPEDFDRVIAQGTRSLIEASRDAGVRRLVYVSALGTTRETSTLVPYYAAKWASEEAVRASGLSHAILRPSFVFGPDGGALERFLRIARLAPVTPVVGPGTQRIQPIWVDDLAEGIAWAAARRDDALVELGGPDVVDWNELWRRIKAALGTRRPQIHLPFWLMKPPAAILGRLPNPPVTSDQLTMLRAGDNVVTDGGASQAALGLTDLVPLDEQLRRAVAERA
jgi:NADH dehydrogenase